MLARDRRYPRSYDSGGYAPDSTDAEAGMNLYEVTLLHYCMFSLCGSWRPRCSVYANFLLYISFINGLLIYKTWMGMYVATHNVIEYFYQSEHTQVSYIPLV